MSSALFVVPLSVFTNPKGARNPFRRPLKEVSASHESLDTGKLCTLQEELKEKLQKRGVDARSIVLSMEKKCTHYLYSGKGEAFLASNSMSIHDFTDEEGNIARRMLVLYPMTPFRQGELAKKQVETAINNDTSEVEIVDLRGFESSQQYLEGTASLIFSADGRFVYMARSARSSEAVLDVLCNEENLNIPPENRFIFDAVVPSKSGDVPVELTNVLGWCGRGICSWCLDFIKFDDPAEQERFYSHLESEYEVVVELSPEEALAFGGSAFEVTDNQQKHSLFISERGLKSLSMANAKALKKWYGSSLVPVYSEVVERRFGTGASNLAILSITHGPAVPHANQPSTLARLRIPQSTV